MTIYFHNSLIFNTLFRNKKLISSIKNTYHFAKDKARHHLTAWIDHVILSLLRKEEYPLTSRLITFDRAWVFQPLENAATVLEMLLHLYWQGLREPLRFFPESSLAFAARLKKGEGVAESLKAAALVWEGSEFAPGLSAEGSDPYFNLCFGEVDPFGDPFGEIALTVFDPLMEHRERER